MINYNPEDASNAWPEGEYAATIESVTPKISKKAEAAGATTANMHEVVLKVYEASGVSQKVWDYVVYPTATWKLEQIADALGQSAAFTSRSFDVEGCVGKNIRVYLRVKKDEYGTKNTIGEYLSPTLGPSPVALDAKANAAVVDADIPF